MYKVLLFSLFYSEVIFWTNTIHTLHTIMSDYYIFTDTFPRLQYY